MKARFLQRPSNAAAWAGALTFALVFVSSCGPKDSGSNTQADGETQQTTTARPETAEPDVPGGGSSSLSLTGIARLTPEQVSRVLEKRLNYTNGWRDGDGRFFDLIVRIFGVPLGGVDFETAFDRDASAKVHTVLVSRTLAWNVATEFIWWELDPKAAKKESRARVLTLVNLKTDFPSEAAPSFPAVADLAARDTRWRAQLDDLYWRLFARPPRPEETAACARAFARAMTHQPSPPAGWVILLYGLLSSAEFWNLWGGD